MPRSANWLWSALVAIAVSAGELFLIKSNHRAARRTNSQASPLPGWLLLVGYISICVASAIALAINESYEFDEWYVDDVTGAQFDGLASCSLFHSQCSVDGPSIKQMYVFSLIYLTALVALSAVCALCVLVFVGCLGESLSDADKKVSDQQQRTPPEAAPHGAQFKMRCVR